MDAPTHKAVPRQRLLLLRRVSAGRVIARRVVAGLLLLGAILAGVLLAGALLASGAVVPLASAAAASLSSQELALVQLINTYRQSLGLQPLMVSERCSEAARKHCSDMAKYGFFGHYTEASDWFPVGADPGVRLNKCGYPSGGAWAETLAAGQAEPAQVLGAWKQSASHNQAMINPEYRVIGVGHVYNPDSQYGYYWTADFGSYVDDTAYWSGTPPGDGAPGGETPAVPFWDISPNDIYFEAIAALAAAGVVGGFPDGSFRPQSSVTRAQFAKMIVLGLQKHTPEIEHATSPTFRDVLYTGSPYPFDYVEEAASLGLIQGYPDRTFRPNECVTRLQAVYMLVGAGGPQLASPSPGTVCPFADVPEDAAGALTVAYYNGLVSGKAAGLFDPYSPTTRGQAAKLLYGLLMLLGK